ncbi:MAG: hypothetical protein K6E96_06835 [Bacteroidales bacterium]|nr:hypothetical protein [Bacteroidales bacterium]
MRSLGQQDPPPHHASRRDATLPTTHYLLPTTHYLLPTTYYPLPTTH